MSVSDLEISTYPPCVLNPSTESIQPLPAPLGCVLAGLRKEKCSQQSKVLLLPSEGLCLGRRCRNGIHQASSHTSVGQKCSSHSTGGGKEP